MIVTPISNHVLAAMARAMQQFQSIPQQYTVTFPLSGVTLPVSGWMGLLGALIDQMQQLENAAFAVNSGQQLLNSTGPAQGAQLDGIGEIVGLARNGMTDPQYIVFLFGQIAANFSKATREDVFNCASFLFGTSVYIQDYEPASIAIEAEVGEFPVSLLPAAKAMLKKVPAGGVGVLFVAQSSAPPFRYSSAVFPTPNINQIYNGYASAVSPGLYPGGKYASVIQ